MSPALLLPVALGALAALAIPLLIHIARRTESRTVAFAALRWLEAKAKPRRRPTLDERWLLAARLLLLALIALFLARPALWGAADRRPVVAVMPGLDPATIEAEQGARLVWLSSGFPPVGEMAPRASANPASLIRQLDAELSPEAALTIAVPSVLDGMDAERPRLSRRVDWRVMQAPVETPAPKPIPPPGLIVRYAPGAEESVRYLRAAAVAWTEPGLRPDFEAAPADRPVDRNTRHLAWLAPGSLPKPVVEWVQRGGTVLTADRVRVPAIQAAAPIWSDPAGEPLAVAGALGRGRVIQLTRPLTPAANPALAEPDFPDVLARMLDPPPPPGRVAAADHAPLTGGVAYPRPPLDLRPWLALFIALTFAAERWMATRRSRPVAA